MAEVKNTAIVTGCSSGIGLATTMLFLEKGYQVFGLDVQDLNNKKIDSEKFHFHKADISQSEQITLAVEACLAKFGPPTALLNIAGIMDAFESASTISDAAWDKIIAVNLTAPVKLMRAVLPHMQAARRGVIVNVCSRASISGASAGLAYTSSKHGLLGATKHTAWRFRNEGIRCNAVLPGGVATNIQASMSKETFDQAAFAECMPVNNLHIDQTLPQETIYERIIKPEDVAKSIYFLASDEAAVLTGVCMPVDKGWSAI